MQLWNQLYTKFIGGGTGEGGGEVLVPTKFLLVEAKIVFCPHEFGKRK